MATDLQSSPEESWLECDLQKGMFSDEIAVTYRPSGKLLKSVFVPQEDVRGEPGSSGKVKVRIFQHSGKIFAILPNPQHDIVQVSQRDLSQ